MDKLVIKNNWESYEYYVNGIRINPYDINTIFDEFNQSYKVSHKLEDESYNDMGHQYTTTRIILVVKHPLGEIIIRPESEVYLKS
jgi:hypothetical protein